MVQSFTRFHRNVSVVFLCDLQLLLKLQACKSVKLFKFASFQVIAPAALFLAAKVEEQPRKLEHVIKVAHACLNPQEPSPDVRSDVSDVQKLNLTVDMLNFGISKWNSLGLEFQWTIVSASQLFCCMNFVNLKMRNLFFYT